MFGLYEQMFTKYKEIRRRKIIKEALVNSDFGYMIISLGSMAYFLIIN